MSRCVCVRLERDWIDDERTTTRRRRVDHWYKRHQTTCWRKDRQCPSWCGSSSLGRAWSGTAPSEPRLRNHGRVCVLNERDTSRLVRERVCVISSRTLDGEW